MALTITIALQAGVPVDFNDQGDFFRIMQATAPLEVSFFAAGRIIVDSPQVSAGYAESFTGKEYEKFTLLSATAQTVEFVSRLGGQVHYDAPPVGAVNIQNTAGAFAQSSASVTNANQVLLAANAARRYLMIQNNAASAVLRVKLDGTAAAVNSGFRVLPGGVLEVPNFATTAAISAMMETADATANNVEIVQG